MKKSRIEDICRLANMKPVKRDMINGAEVFIADGFSPPPHQKFAKFGVNPTDFPFGAYVTLWWVQMHEDDLDTGQPLFFDAFHNSELEHGSRQGARINSALKTAGVFLSDRRKARADA